MNFDQINDLINHQVTTEIDIFKTRLSDKLRSHYSSYQEVRNELDNTTDTQYLMYQLDYIYRQLIKLGIKLDN